MWQIICKYFLTLPHFQNTAHLQLDIRRTTNWPLIEPKVPTSLISDSAPNHLMNKHSCKITENVRFRQTKFTRNSKCHSAEFRTLETTIKSYLFWKLVLVRQDYEMFTKTKSEGRFVLMVISMIIIPLRLYVCSKKLYIELWMSVYVRSYSLWKSWKCLHTKYKWKYI
jgi:hypothetical protein